MFIVMNIGCLCCDTPSEIVASFDSYEEAFKYVDVLEFTCDTTRNEYNIFELPSHPMKLNSKYEKLFQIGQKREEECKERMKQYEEEKQNRELQKRKITEAYNLAKQMRGTVTDTRIDDDYIKKYIPKDILDKMTKCYEWTDEEGYTWGFIHVTARQDEKGVFISLATRYDGHGYSSVKVIRIDNMNYDIEIMNYM